MMRIRRLTFILTEAVLLLFWVLTEQSLFAALAAALLLMALVSLILFLISVNSFSAEIHAPELAGKNEEFSVTICLPGGLLANAMDIRPFGLVTNQLTGESAALPSSVPAPDKHGASLRLQMTSPWCGKLSIHLDRLRITDPMGLFSRDRFFHHAAETLILPDTFRVAVQLRTPDLPETESDEYSPTYPGDDPSELFGIRDYREGDALRSVHWKLSEKYDRTVVREMSLPVAHSVLLLLDNAPKADVLPEAASRSCEGLISLSQSLAEESIPHQIGWLNHETGLINLYNIGALDDLYGLQSLLLSCRVMPDETGIVPAVLEQEGLTFSHLILFAAAEPEGIAALAANTTLLLPAEDPEYGISSLPEKLEALII